MYMYMHSTYVHTYVLIHTNARTALVYIYICIHSTYIHIMFIFIHAYIEGRDFGWI